ncbi:MAG: PaaI family thioesterase [Solirubrobacteraceae bacterium]
MSLGEVAESNAQAALETPLLRFLGATLDRAQDGGYGLEITLGESSLNGVRTLHAGAISLLLEVAAYLAVVAHLAEDEQAVTHAFTACYLAAAHAGERLRSSGTLVRRTRRLAFLAAELRSEETLIATASVTKSILQVRRSP